MHDHDDQHSTEHLGSDFAARLADLESKASADEQAAIAALPSGSALLIVRRGPTVGARFLLDSETTIAGRHPDADIFLDDVTVSRRHSEITRTGTQFAIRDLDSLNGTYLDGERVAENSATAPRSNRQVSDDVLPVTPRSSRRRISVGALKAGSTPTGQSIGQVLTQLRIQFPDLTSTKLRYLEEERPISPTRLSSGYRSYTASDVSRIRMVLTLQRDHFLPLKVIQGILDDVDAGKKPSLPSGAELTVESMLSIEVRYTRTELLSKTGAPASLLNDAITMGLIVPSEIYGEETYTILAALVELKKSGLEPRHLRTLKLQAEKDATTLRNVVLPVAKSSSRVGRQKAIDMARDLAVNLEKVRLAVMMRSVDESID